MALVPVGTADAAEEVAAPIGAGYVPQDKDERGLWLQLDDLEREMKTSEFVIRDPALNAYVRGVLCRMVGDERCAAIRLYIVRSAEFNATMAPNGMMTVYTGLLLRARDEAQLAAVLGHEFTHFSHRHTVQTFRDAKSKANTLAWLSIVPTASYGTAAAMMLVRLTVVGSHYRFSREMESEADAGSIPLMAAAGYDPREAAKVWEQLRAEEDATAAARKRRARKRAEAGFFASHPPNAERVAALTALAAAVTPGSGAPPIDARARYRAALASWWPQLIDDQIKLNDFGATDFLIGHLAQEGWTPALLYARGELYRARGRPEDLSRSAGFYRAAIDAGGAPEALRGLGLAMIRAGDVEAGRRALQDYLAVRPDATDRVMIGMLAGDVR